MTLTKQIFELNAPYDNPYQGKDKRVLFVCSAGILRSATAANIYAAKGYNTRCAGSAPYALVPISINLLAWAQHIVFINPENWEESMEVFKNTDFLLDIKDAVVLDIPDIYHYKAPKLIQLLEEQLDGRI